MAPVHLRKNVEINGIHAQLIRMEQAREKLSRLMPYDEWCHTLNPTETAKEMYEYVRVTLEQELEQSRRGYSAALGNRAPHRSGQRREETGS